jgi:hypothetical protein
MRLRCGTTWSESSYIFTHDDGKPIFPRRPSAWFAQFIKRNDLPHITFHQLRHTNASLQISGEVDIVTLSGRLGMDKFNEATNASKSSVMTVTKSNKSQQFPPYFPQTVKSQAKFKNKKSRKH